MPPVAAAYPQAFRDDVATVARRDPAPLSPIAKGSVSGSPGVWWGALSGSDDVVAHYLVSREVSLVVGRWDVTGSSRLSV